MDLLLKMNEMGLALLMGLDGVKKLKAGINARKQCIEFVLDL